MESYPCSPYRNQTPRNQEDGRRHRVHPGPEGVFVEFHLEAMARDTEAQPSAREIARRVAENLRQSSLRHTDDSARVSETQPHQIRQRDISIREGDTEGCARVSETQPPQLRLRDISIGESDEPCDHLESTARMRLEFSDDLIARVGGIHHHEVRAAVEKLKSFSMQSGNDLGDVITEILEMSIQHIQIQCKLEVSETPIIIEKISEPLTVCRETDLVIGQSPVEQVALTVPNTDDPSMPVWTFRTWTLGILSCILITFLNTFFSYRAEPILITVTTTLIGMSPLGQLMAAVLPDKRIHLPWTPKSWTFSLNPGPFNVKEHTLITIFSSAGSLRPAGLSVVNTITIFFERHLAAAAGLLFLLTTEVISYSMAGLMQTFLVEPAEMWWPASLVNVSIVRALHQQEDRRTGLPQIQFFYICLIASFAYYVLPGYLFSSLTSLSLLCYAYPNNTLAQQLGSGTRGLGIGAFSFDWASISAFLGSPLITPWFAVVNILGGFLLQTYVLVPYTYWKNIFHAKSFPIFSTNLYNLSGLHYNVSAVLNTNLELDRESVASQGVAYTSTFFAITCGVTFATFGALVSHVFLFHGRAIARRCGVAVRATEEPVDVHTELMKAYPAVPRRWYLLLFSASIGLSIFTLQVYSEQLQMKWWGLLLAVAIASLLLLPIGVLVATTNMQPNLAIIPQYLMGYISPGRPIANIVFRTYSTLVCGRTIAYLSNVKLGHYMKIPPRATFTVQLIGLGVATTTSWAVSRWLRNSIDHICDRSKLPASTAWTCPQDRVFYDQAVIWGLIGPQKTFGVNGPYRPLLWFFVVGVAAPFFPWLASKLAPNWPWLKLLNMPLIFQGAAQMPPAAVVNNSAWLTVATFFSCFVYMRNRQWWQRYNYVLSAAMDAGTALMGVLLNYSFDGKPLHWWGTRTDKCHLASCPTAPGIVVPGCSSR